MTGKTEERRKKERKKKVELGCCVSFDKLKRNEDAPKHTKSPKHTKITLPLCDPLSICGSHQPQKFRH